MSEFFKALEQAERDRQLAERNEQSATVAESADPAVDGGEAPSGVGTMSPVEPFPVAATAAPPVAPPAASRPEVTRRVSVFARPPAPVERTIPLGGERAQAAERATVPTHPEPPVAERQPAPPRERQVPPVAEPAPPRERQVPPAAPRVVPMAEPASKALEADPPPLQRATTPPKRRGDAPMLIADLDPRSVAAEAYRTLRANLEFMPSERGCRNIVITSPSMGEGKSTTVANLAVVAAQAGSRVCLVDADMRRPTMHRVFGVPNQGGFTRALSQAMPLASVAVPTAVANLSLVVAGSSDGLRPAQLLNAPRLQKVLHDPATPFDLVLFDTPPVISVADAMNLAAHCDGVVLVVRAGAVPPSVLQQAVRQIEQVHAKVLGVLLNQVDLRRGEAEFYRYYRAYYSTATKD